jgi:predicted nucleic acid-binding protein
MSLVVDASALAYASISGDEGAARLRRMLRDEVVHAPHLVDAELGNVLRSHVLRGDMTEEHAAAVMQHAPGLVDHRYGHTGAFAAAAWALREKVTFYDGMYIALAAALRIPLVTTDARLAGAPGLPCTVETPNAGSG